MVVTALGLTLFSGCGENFSAGVSFGGTGTGPSLGGGTVKPPDLGNPDDNKGPISLPYDHYELIYPEPIFMSDNCEGTIRTFQFIDKTSGKVILSDSQQALFSMDAKTSTNVLLRLNIKNTTSHVVYEYFNACKAPIKIIDGDNTELEGNHRFSCNSNDTYMQFYQPNDEKNYDFDVDLPNKLTTWRFVYQPSYTFAPLPYKEGRMLCPPLEALLDTVLIKDRPPKTELHLEGD